MAKMSFLSALTAISLVQQAHRSIAHAMPPTGNSWWPYMLDYYQGSRINALRSSSGFLLELAQSNQSDPVIAIRSRLEKRVAAWRFWTKLVAKFSFKSNCGFAADEISFISDSTAKLIQVLEGEIISNKEAVVLRDDLLLCLRLFFFRCPALQRVKKAAYIENFNMPDFLTHYTLDETIKS